MCGIVGCLSFERSKFEITAPNLTAMRDTMALRGPDGCGLWISPDRKVGFGHRRLSIVDLSDAAAQPMCNEDGSIWLTFNGEIYNHLEIRAELEKIGGHTWKTNHSDTEMILHAYEQWGIDCVKKFRGMFAIGLWDNRSRTLWLVRDRIGIKPMYYSVHHGRITFASEIKALLQDPEQKRSINETSFFHYLSFLTSPVSESLFEGIRKLPGGCWLRITEDGQVTEERYWELWDHTKPLTGVSEEEICERLLSELRTAVQLRKMSDVPVGVFLSGGIDSSTNAALFSEGENRPVKTFSIGYDAEYGSYANELHYARKMAEIVHSEHYERRLTQSDLLDFLPKMVQLQDEPLADPVCVPVFYVSKLARDNGVIVCQLGEGSDELFWGYPNWKLALQLERLNSWPVPRFAKAAGLQLMSLMGQDQSRPFEALRRGVERYPVFWGGAEAFTHVEKQHLMSARLRKQFAGRTSWEAVAPIRTRFEEKAWEKSTLNWMSYVDLNFRLPELLLMRVDKMSMGVSLECRVPFLDHKFVELAMSIPEAVKIRNGTLKYILKKTVKGVIPDELIHRKKQGFGVPVHEWLLDRLGNYAAQAIGNFCDETDLLDKNKALELVRSRSPRLSWVLLNAALWWQEYIQEQGESRAAGVELDVAT